MSEEKQLIADLKSRGFDTSGYVLLSNMIEKEVTITTKDDSVFNGILKAFLKGDQGYICLQMENCFRFIFNHEMRWIDHCIQ